MGSQLYGLSDDGLGLAGLGPIGAFDSRGEVTTPVLASPSLGSRLVGEMATAWRRGERPTAEAFLDRHPELSEEAALRLIYEEFCLRQEAGQEVAPVEVAGRFPAFRAELEVLLDCHRLIGGFRAEAVFPEVGEVPCGFRLLAELGRGASGRVFLAAQDSLAARPVVLKFATCAQNEHLTLASLQHMNIMPIYSEQVLLSKGLRVLCMPYLGGATLARILEMLVGRPPCRRSGKDLVDALDRAEGSRAVRPPGRGPYRGLLARSGYVPAIAWIGACLADGLQYAHERGFVHMDIKPSNVLLSGDCQAMLLDFHLARGPVEPGGPPPPQLGGTPAYASPEHRSAMASIRKGRPIGVAVDGRSDIYSLGVLLYEALGGSRPARDESGAVVPLERINPQVSAGLSDLIAKCLRPDPRDRFGYAEELANDLRRHLNHQPLLSVPNRSPIERWRKWRRRRPSALPRQVFLGLSASVVVAASALLASAYRHRVHEIEESLDRSRAYRDGARYVQAEAALRHGLALAGSMPGFESWRPMLAKERRGVLRDQKAAELHQLADLVRFRDGLAPDPSEEARSIVGRGLELWWARHQLLGPVRGRPESEVEPRIRTDLLDLMTVWADLRVRLAGASEQVEARVEALARLDEVASALGSGPALERLRRNYGEALGRFPSGAGEIEPRTAWEHCDLGRACLRDGELRRANEHFGRAVDLRPQDFWPNFYQGVCTFKLGRFEEALDAFRVCISLARHPAECYFNRALTFEALGRTSEALHDYTRALECDSRFAGAALNRGVLHYRAGHYAEADDDLRRALAMTATGEARGVVHYNKALVALARDDRAAALIELEAAHGYGHAQARELSDRLRTPRDHRDLRSPGSP
jgi:eukaryotic-like serine/threonine-protein kinase